MCSDGWSKKVRIIRSADVRWEEAPSGPEEFGPPGQECVAASSGDKRIQCSLWRRDSQRRDLEPRHHEIAYIVEGQVEVTDDDGNLLVAGPGDILITPGGDGGYWKNLSPVMMFRAVYEDSAYDLEAYLGPGGF
jgi:uncharacterized cupin superfamily protein